jgi:hypothetical protein
MRQWFLPIKHSEVSTGEEHPKMCIQYQSGGGYQEVLKTPGLGTTQ